MDINIFESKYVNPDIEASAYPLTETLKASLVGEVVFLDGVSKSAAFDTISDPINLFMFDEGEIRVTVADKSSSPTLVVQFGTVDLKTGAFDSSGEIEFTEDGHGKIKFTSGLLKKMAINATLSGGSFTVTITGEFKKAQ